MQRSVCLEPPKRGSSFCLGRKNIYWKLHRVGRRLFREFLVCKLAEKTCIPLFGSAWCICFLHRKKGKRKEKKLRNHLQRCSMCRERRLMTCSFPHQHHYPLPHDHMGSGRAAVCGRSGHALLPIYLRVSLPLLLLYIREILTICLSGSKITGGAILLK